MDYFSIFWNIYVGVHVNLNKKTFHFVWKAFYIVLLTH